jgi:hypothetical protein
VDEQILKASLSGHFAAAIAIANPLRELQRCALRWRSPQGLIFINTLPDSSLRRRGRTFGPRKAFSATNIVGFQNAAT